MRIDWGYAYLSAPQQKQYDLKFTSMLNIIKDFLPSGLLNSTDTGKNIPDKDLLLAANISLFTGNDNTNQATIMLSYDDIYSIQYFNQNMQAWWKKNFENMDALLETSAATISKHFINV